MATTTARPQRAGRDGDAGNGTEKGEGLVLAGSMDDLRKEGVLTVSGASGGVRHAVAVFLHEGRVYALDNRCPHMGFPLSRGSCSEGIVICYWHYARFDLASGGTFDPFADDVRTYPVEVREGQVWVDLRGAADTPQQRAAERQRWMKRLDDGLEQSIPLVQSKAVLQLLDLGTPVPEIVERAARYPLRFGSRRNARGWGDGLTILTAMANIMEDVGQEERSLALYHGIRRAVEDTSARVERVQLDPLPGPAGAERGAIPVERLKAWFRQFIEVRHQDAAERALRTAIAAGATPAQLADMLGAAATDHYYRDFSHVMDTVAKQCELLDLIGWEAAPLVLPAVVSQLATQHAGGGGQRLAPPDRPGGADRAPDRPPGGRGRRGRGARRAVGRGPGGGPAGRRPGGGPGGGDGGVRGRSGRGRRGPGPGLRLRPALHPLPHQQRVRGLGHGAAPLHLLRLPGPDGQAGAFGGPGAGGAARGDGAAPGAVPEHPAGAPAV